MRGKERASSSMRSSSAQLLGPGENDGASMASCSLGGGSRVETSFCPKGPLDAGEPPAEGVLILTALERTLCSDIFLCLLDARMRSESSGLTIYCSGAMVARVGLMVMTCKARRNRSEARAASVRDPWLIVDNCLLF